MNHEIAVAVTQLVHASALANDDRDWPGLAALYTEAGVLTRPNGQQAEGRAAIEAAYASGSPTRRTRHVCANTIVTTDEAGRRATARTTVLVYSWEHDPDLRGLASASGPVIGEFLDEVEPTPDGWRIARRIATLAARAE